MGQTRLYLTAPRAEAERIYAALEAEFESDGFPVGIFEVDEERDLHEVSIYIENGVEAAEARLHRLAGDLQVLREDLPDVDWVAKSLEGLRPVRAGPFLVHGSHDRGERRPGDLAIEIEAGLAFGTGHHGTTSGCLEMIADVVAGERPRNALDLGAGSAVLAIAVAKLARIPVLATDIDPVAVEVAEQNVQLNEVANLVETVVATGFDDSAFAAWKPFDLIVANILARPLMELAPDMARHISADGSVILSGILAAQRDAVLSAYEARSFRHVRTVEREGWVTLHLKG